MSKSITVLTPNIETAEDFNRIGKQLSENAIHYLERNEFEHIPEKELKANLDAILIWMQFSRAFRKGKGLFLTWEELKNLPFSKLENTLKFMLDNEYLKEVQIEWSPTGSPLCPFCGKPSTYPNKAKHYIFFKKIITWSCNYEKCPMYRKPYYFEW